MLEDLIRECRCLSKFARIGKGICGDLVIEGGSIGLPLLPGQYFWISGSVFNDGLHREGDALTDESFYGEATPLAIPQPFVDLADRVSKWNANQAEPSPVQSESFGGYSYTRATGKNGGAYTWRDAFSSELAKWRMI